MTRRDTGHAYSTSLFLYTYAAVRRLGETTFLETTIYSCRDNNWDHTAYLALWLIFTTTVWDRE
jgi:hypothetical protein